MSDGLPVALRIKRAAIRLARTLRRRLSGTGTVYVDQRLGQYRGYWEAAARQISAELTPLTREIWEVRRGDRTTRISNHLVEIDDLVTMLLAGDKAWCYRLAEGLGVRVPRYVVFRLSSIERAQQLLQDHPGRYVVKPVRGSSSGVGITTLVETPRQLERAACLASLQSDELLLDRMIFGESLRLLFLGGCFLHAVRRRGVRVRGDGRSSIAQLLRAAGNADLETDLTTRLTLADQGLQLGTIPADGTELLVRSLPAGVTQTRELRTEYDEEVTTKISEALIDEAGRVVRGLGSRFAGVDVITRDPTVSLVDGGGAFIEINTTPGIHHHYVDGGGGGPDVAVRVLRFIFEMQASEVHGPPAARVTAAEATGEE